MLVVLLFMIELALSESLVVAFVIARLTNFFTLLLATTPAANIITDRVIVVVLIVIVIFS
jgi:hypothetical protein